jgi:4,5-dihydroxyphthalate decarboxylase
MNAAPAPVTLRVALGGHSHVQPIRDGTLADPRIRFDFVEIEPVTRAFAPMIREQAFDLSELAIVTALQAIAYGRPIILLPIVLSSRFQRQCLIGYRPRALPDPRDLAGKCVGVRAFTQTTGMWVRAALFQDYGVRSETIRWRSSEPAHVPDYVDPPFVSRDDSGESLPDQLRKGMIDAAIMGNDRPQDPDFVPLIADHAAADRRAYEQQGFMPINHMVAVSADAATRKPEALRIAYALLRRGIERVLVAPGAPISAMAGFDRLGDAMAYAIEEAERQALIPYSLAVDEVFAPARRLLRER